MSVLIEVLTNKDNESIVFNIQSTQKLIGFSSFSGATEPKVQRVNGREVSEDAQRIPDFLPVQTA